MDTSSETFSSHPHGHPEFFLMTCKAEKIASAPIGLNAKDLDLSLALPIIPSHILSECNPTARPDLQ